MNFLDENGLGRLWAQIILKLNSKVPDGGTTGQVLKKTETGTEWADASFKPAGKSYLTFSSLSSFTLAVEDATKHWNGTLEYFASDRTWTTWDGTTTLSSIDNDGEYVLYLRGTGNTVITGNNSNYRWVFAGSDISCAGNIENLLDYATVTAGNHPAMAYHCYENMFYGCTSLTQAPALPATTLAEYCYYDMFYGCTSLTQAPALPATTLSNYCYRSMFQGCTSLKLSTTQTDEYTQEYRIPSSGTGTTATSALTDMFTSTGGTFTGTPEINTTYYLSSDNMIVRETEISTLNGYVGSMIMASAIPVNEKGSAGGVASLGADGKVPSTQLPSLDYIPTSQKGAASGVASLGADGKVPSAQLPEMGGETYTVTLPNSGWAADGSYLKQTVTVTGLKASYPVSPVVDAQLSGTDAEGDIKILEAFAAINILQTAENQLIAYCLGDLPAANIPLIINTWG